MDAPQETKEAAFASQLAGRLDALARQDSAPVPSAALERGPASGLQQADFSLPATATGSTVSPQHEREDALSTHSVETGREASGPAYTADSGAEQPRPSSGSSGSGSAAAAAQREAAATSSDAESEGRASQRSIRSVRSSGRTRSAAQPARGRSRSGSGSGSGGSPADGEGEGARLGPPSEGSAASGDRAVGFPSGPPGAGGKHWTGVSYVDRLRKFRSYFFHPSNKKTSEC
jgi:hypothetical protein